MTRQILECSLRALPMATGLWAVLGLLGIRNASARHKAWLAVVIAMLLLPLWTVWGPKVETPGLPAASELSAIEWLPQAESAAFATASVPSHLPAQAPPPSSDWNWGNIAVRCYFAGLALMSMRLMAGTVLACRIRKRATIADGFLESHQCSAPITIGFIDPVVILPCRWREWSGAKLNAVLAHEREHVRRRDPLAQWLAMFNRCIFWFHPLAWWLERKLSAVAEEACDAEVIAGGYAPADYSQYLIELARLVERAHSRVTLQWGSAMTGSRLSERIRRILAGTQYPTLSRGRAVAAVSLCAIVLVGFAACTAQRVLKAGQPTMAELQHSREKHSEGLQQTVELARQSHSLTAADAAELEAKLKANPRDHYALIELANYYQFQADTKGLDALTLWFIEHAPEVQWAWNINPAGDPDGYRRGRDLWLAQLKKPNSNPQLYLNAVAYLEAGDKPVAEQVLLEGQKATPSLNWKRFLGGHYGRAVVQSSGDYALRIRALLSTTTDAPLLTSAADGLFSFSLGDGVHRTGPEWNSLLALANFWNNRALAMRPEYNEAHWLRLRLDDLRIDFATGDLTPSDRMKHLRQQLQRPAGTSGTLEPTGRELLVLAAQNVNDPESGSALFFANLALGEASLKRGATSDAKKYLKSAAAVQPDERLRYGHLDFTLARRLVDRGERDAVAQFLERCSKFNVNPQNSKLGEWAAAIRKGINPDLIPYRLAA